MEIHEIYFRLMTSNTPSPTLDLVQSLMWGLDGSLVVKGATKGVYGLYRVHPQTGQSSLMVAEEDGVMRVMPAGRVSSDGKKLVYGKQLWSVAGLVPPQPGIIWLEKDLSTGVEREITRSFKGGLSPNGQYLAPIGEDPKRPRALSVRALNGGELRELAPEIGGSDFLAANWSPDSSAMYALKTTGELWRFPIDGSEPQKVNLNLEGVSVTRLSVHPDGHRIALQTQPKQPSGLDIWVLESFLPSVKAGK